MIRSVKLLTEIPATSTLKSNCNPTGGKKKSFWVEEETDDVVLTFQDGVKDSLFDLGFIYHIGSHLSEDELPWPWFKTIPVVFDNRHAVLKKPIRQIMLRLIEHFVFFLSAEYKAITLTCSLRMI